MAGAGLAAGAAATHGCGRIVGREAAWAPGAMGEAHSPPAWLWVSERRRTEEPEASWEPGPSPGAPVWGPGRALPGRSLQQLPTGLPHLPLGWTPAGPRVSDPLAGAVLSGQEVQGTSPQRTHRTRTAP